MKLLLFPPARDQVAMSLKIALLGPATLVGEKLLELLDESSLEVDELALYEPEDQAGRSLMFRGHAHRTRALEELDTAWPQLILVCEAGLSQSLRDDLGTAGARVIDLYPQRYESDQVFLTIPDLNGDELASLDPGRIIGIPNSATIAAALALAPLHRSCQILKANIMVLSPVSAAGQAGIEALASETARLLNGREVETAHFGQQIAFNLIPQAGALQDNGFTDIETAVLGELPLILGDDGLELEVSAVQVPVFYGDMVVVQAETRQALDMAAIQIDMDRASGVRMDPPGHRVASLAKDAIGQSQVVVTRLRPAAEGGAGFALHAMSDDLGRGSALTALEAVMRLAGQRQVSQAEGCLDH